MGTVQEFNVADKISMENTTLRASKREFFKILLNKTKDLEVELFNIKQETSKVRNICDNDIESRINDECSHAILHEREQSVIDMQSYIEFLIYEIV